MACTPFQCISIQYTGPRLNKKEQQEVVGRIERINPVIRSVMIAWILLAVVSADLWIWEGFRSF
ncbi:MAG TPA: hypothetical protein VIX19_20290 [Terriglobales bacterium]